MRKAIDKAKRNWKILLVVASFAVVAIVFFNILWGDPNLTNAIVAFGTLTLALVTALHIINSNEQEKRRREDELLRQRRQRDKDELNKIIDWAIDISKCELPVEVVAVVGIQNTVQERRFVNASLVALASKLRSILGESLYTSKIASMYEVNLGTAVDKVVTDVRAHIDILDKCKSAVDNNNFAEFSIATNELHEHWRELLQSVDNTIAEACNIKIEVLSI